MKKTGFTLFLALTLLSTAFAQTNYGLTFNGSGQYVTLPSGLITNGATNFTIEFWAKPSASSFDGNYHGILGYQGAVNGRNPGVWANSGQLHLDAYQYSTQTRYDYLSSAGFFVQDEWTHVAWVKEGTTFHVYRNGIETHSYPAPAQINIPGNYYLGYIDNYFAGMLDEVRFWSVARTAEQIRLNLFNRNLANNASGLIAYYRFNDGSGSTLTNSCTNTSGINGTLGGSPAWTASPVQFSPGSLNLDGTNDYLSLPSGVYFNDNTFTVETWVYERSYQSYSRVLDFGNGAPSDNVIFCLSDGISGKPSLMLYSGTSGSNTVVASDAIPLNTWTHLALVLNGTTCKIYINGLEKASATVTQVPQNLSRAYNYIGKSNWVANGYADALFDDFRIWSTARTAAEIQGNRNKELDPAAQTDLLVYYTFNEGIPAGTNTGLKTITDLRGTANASMSNMNLSGASSNLAAQTIIYALPLRWGQFTANLVRKSVQLEWYTYAETNCLNYTIEKSADGLNWEKEGILSAQGNSQNQYQWLDEEPYDGYTYYRLRQTDLDGNFSFSEIRKVMNGKTAPEFRISGISSRNRVDVEMYQPATLHWYNSEGKEVLKISLEKGKQVLDLAQLQKGVYVVRTKTQLQRIMLTD